MNVILSFSSFKWNVFIRLSSTSTINILWIKLFILYIWIISLIISDINIIYFYFIIFDLEINTNEYIIKPSIFSSVTNKENLKLLLTLKRKSARGPPYSIRAAPGKKTFFFDFIVLNDRSSQTIWLYLWKMAVKTSLKGRFWSYKICNRGLSSVFWSFFKNGLTVWARERLIW
jgi:hypothetical protein